MARVSPLSGSIRATVWVPPLTHTESNPTVTPHGPSGTASVVTTSFVAGSMPTTSFSAYELIQTRPRPSATSHGVGTLSIEAIARSSARGPAAAEPAGDAAADATGSVDGVAEGGAAELVGVTVPPPQAATIAASREAARGSRGSS